MIPVLDFFHQDMENVVKKVPVSLFSHLTEHMVEDGLLDLDHWCKSGFCCCGTQIGIKPLVKKKNFCKAECFDSTSICLSSYSHS